MQLGVAIKRGLARREPALFYEIVLLFCLGVVCKYALARAMKDPFEESGVIAATVDMRPLSIANLVPSSALRSSEFHRVVAILLLIAAVMFALRIKPKISGIATALLYPLSVSLMYSAHSVVHHRYHLVAQLIIPYAACGFLYSNLWESPIYSRQYWSRPRVYPVWLYYMGLFAICMSYAWAGISKILVSGLSWMDGIALQAWLWNKHGQGSSGSPNFLIELILESSAFAAFFSTLTLAVEIGCLASLYSSTLRVLCGIALLGMHAAIYCTLGIVFPANIILVALYFLGLRELINNRWRLHRNVRRA